MTGMIILARTRRVSIHGTLLFQVSLSEAENGNGQPSGPVGHYTMMKC